MKTDPDLKLIRQSKEGRRAAFGKLVRKYQDPIFELVYDYLGNYEEARDTAQDVFMKAFNRLGSFEEKARFSTWLYRIAVNQSLDVIRKKERQKLILNREKREPADQDDTTSRNGAIDLDQAGLSEAQHTAIILRFFQDMSVPEIAEIMDCSESTVRTHVYRAVNKLRRQTEFRP